MGTPNFGNAIKNYFNSYIYLARLFEAFLVGDFFAELRESKSEIRSIRNEQQSLHHLQEEFDLGKPHYASHNKS